MADTATSRLRLLQIEQYTKDGTWGPEFNVGALDRVDEAFGTTEVTIGGDVTLTVNNFIADQARSLVLKMSGAGGFVVTVPARDKPYLVVNGCVADVTVTPLGGVGAVVRAGTAVWWYSDGTDGFVADTTLDKIKAPAASVSLNSQRITNLATPVAGTDAANKDFVFAYGGPGAEASAIAAAASAAAALISEMNAAAYAASINPANLQPIDATLTSLSGIALQQGDLLYATAADTVVRLPKGTANQLLSMNTGATAPTWVAPGALTLLSTQTVVGVASVDFTSGITSAYDEYELRFNNVAPATDSVELWLRTSTNAGVSFDAAAASYGWNGTFTRATVHASISSASDTKIILARSDGASQDLGNAAGERAYGIVRLIRPADAALFLVQYDVSWLSAASGAPVRFNGVGSRLAAADVDALRILMSSGNIATGTFALYGVRKAN